MPGLDKAQWRSPLPSDQRSVSVIVRRRLIDRLEESANRTLTLIIGPAGSGKTELIAQWRMCLGGARSFLAVEVASSSATGLVDDLFRSVDRPDLIRPDGGSEELAVELAEVLDERARRDGDTWVIIDSVTPLFTSEQVSILETLSSLVSSSIHLIVASRVAPAMPLGHLRDDDRVGHVNADELAFTASEIQELALGLLGRHLNESEFDDVFGQTRGWASGVKCVLEAPRAMGLGVRDGLVSIQRAEPLLDGILLRTVVDPLPRRLVSFLSDIAELDHVDPATCDEAFVRADSRELLDELDRCLGFVRCLDARLRTYEVFPLLRDALRRESARSDPERVLRVSDASLAFGQARGDGIDEARRLLAEGRASEAIDVLGRVVLAPMSDSLLHRARALVEVMPLDEVRAHPRGLQIVVTLEISLGNAPRVLELLEVIEAGIDPDASTAWTERTFVHAARANLAPWYGDAAVPLAEAEAMLALLDDPPDAVPSAIDPPPFKWARSLVLINGGGALMRLGRFDEAMGWLERAERTSAGLSRLTARSIAVQSLVLAARGDLSDAIRSADRSVALAELALPRQAPRVEVHLARALVHLERNELVAAAAATDAAARVGEVRIKGEHRARIVWLRARIALALGAYREGLLACETWRADVSDAFDGDLTDALNAVEIRLALKHGHARHARRVAERSAPGPRLRAAEALLDVVDDDLRSLAVHVDTWPAWGAVVERIEYHLFGAIRAERVGHFDDVRRHLVAAAKRAEPEGFSRVFFDAAPAVADLVRRASFRTPDAWLTRLAWRIDPLRVEREQRLRLSPREADVLELLPTDFTTAQMADHLDLSVSTVKTHLRVIYRKLRVGSRGEAVLAATERGRIAPLRSGPG